VAAVKRQLFIRMADGELSRPLLMPETVGSPHIDLPRFRLPAMANTAKHSHTVQEQIYHVLEGDAVAAFRPARRPEAKAQAR
jgi:uncharacterized RmlC-like cupin family protein